MQISNFNQLSDELKTLPNRDLVLLIQKTDDSLPFEVLYKRWFSRLRYHRYLSGVSSEDAEDILFDVWRKVWIGLNRNNFEYRGDRQFCSWLLRTLKHACIDFTRKQEKLQKWQSSISLDAEVEGGDGDTIPFIEVKQLDFHDITDEKMRDFVLEIAEEICNNDKQLNDKQLKLLQLRLAKQPLPPEWTESWVNTNWHRLRKLIINELKVRNRL